MITMTDTSAILTGLYDPRQWARMAKAAGMKYAL